MGQSQGLEPLEGGHDAALQQREIIGRQLDVDQSVESSQKGGRQRTFEPIVADVDLLQSAQSDQRGRRQLLQRQPVVAQVEHAQVDARRKALRRHALDAVAAEIEESEVVKSFQRPYDADAVVGQVEPLQVDQLTQGRCR